VHACCAFVLYRSYMYDASTSRPPIDPPPPTPEHIYGIRTYVGAHTPLNIKSAFSRFRSAQTHRHRRRRRRRTIIRIRTTVPRPRWWYIHIYIYLRSFEPLARTSTRIQHACDGGCMRCPVTYFFFLFLIIRSKTDFSRFPRGGYIYFTSSRPRCRVYTVSGSWCSMKYAPQTKYYNILWRSVLYKMYKHNNVALQRFDDTADVRHFEYYLFCTYTILYYKPRYKSITIICVRSRVCTCGTLECGRDPYGISHINMRVPW